MGVIDDGHAALSVADHLEASVRRAQGAHLDQYFLGRHPQKHRRRIDGRQVIGIEAPRKTEERLHTVDLQVQSFKTVFNETGFEIGRRLQRVGSHRCLGVLHHHHPVLVVNVGEGKGRGRQCVEETFLRLDIIGKRLVEIQMVVGDVAENTAGECQTLNAVLANGVGADLHEAVLAARFHHTGKQSVQFQRIRSGVSGSHLLVTDAVHDGGQKTRLATEAHEKTVQQRHRGGLAVGAGDADEFQLAARVVEVGVGNPSQCHRAILDTDIAHLVGRLGGQLLTEHRTGTSLHCLRNVQVPVGLRAALGHIQCGNTLFFRVLYFAGIKFNPADFDFRTAFDLTTVDTIQ